MSYEHLVLKHYLHWTLYLNENQSYLGRAYAWLRRPGKMQRLSSLRAEERQELFGRVLPEYERAIEQFRPDHVNYAWLGDEFTAHQGHGHLHVIPRYAGPRKFFGAEFTDERWGSNYAPAPVKEFTDYIFAAIRASLVLELKD